MLDSRRVPENDIEAMLFRRLIETSVSQWPDLHVMVSATHDEGIWRIMLMPAGQDADGIVADGTIWIRDVPADDDLVRFVVGWHVGDQTGGGDPPRIDWPEIASSLPPVETMSVDRAAIGLESIVIVLASETDPDAIRAIVTELLGQRANAAMAIAQAAGVPADTLDDIRQAITAEPSAEARFA